MKTNWRTNCLGAAIASLLLSAMASAAEKPSPVEIMKAMAEAGQPGPAHEKLQQLAGTWEFTCKFWMDPSQPAMESRGTIERKMILGGRFLEERTHATTLDGRPAYEGFGLVGYDNAQKTYTATWASSVCTGSARGTGEADASGRNFIFNTEAYCPVQKKMIQMRDELKLEAPDRSVATSWQTIDGKEVKMMEIIAVRKN